MIDSFIGFIFDNAASIDAASRAVACIVSSKTYSYELTKSLTSIELAISGIPCSPRNSDLEDLEIQYCFDPQKVLLDWEDALGRVEDALPPVAGLYMFKITRPEGEWMSEAYDYVSLIPWPIFAYSFKLRKIIRIDTLEDFSQAWTNRRGHIDDVDLWQI